MNRDDEERVSDSTDSESEYWDSDEDSDTEVPANVVPFKFAEVLKKNDKEFVYALKKLEEDYRNMRSLMPVSHKTDGEKLLQGRSSTKPRLFPREVPAGCLQLINNAIRHNVDCGFSYRSITYFDGIVVPFIHPQVENRRITLSRLQAIVPMTNITSLDAVRVVIFGLGYQGKTLVDEDVFPFLVNHRIRVYSLGTIAAILKLNKWIIRSFKKPIRIVALIDAFP